MEKLDLKDYLIMVLNDIAELPTIEGKDTQIPDLIPKKAVLDILKNKKSLIDDLNKQLPKTYSKVMYVEDGSVDVEELTENLIDTKVIVYRQGGRLPELTDLSSNPIKSL